MILSNRVEPLYSWHHWDPSKKKMPTVERCPQHRGFAQIGTFTSNTCCVLELPTLTAQSACPYSRWQNQWIKVIVLSLHHIFKQNERKKKTKYRLKLVSEHFAHWKKWKKSNIIVLFQEVKQISSWNCL